MGAEATCKQAAAILCCGRPLRTCGAERCGCAAHDCRRLAALVGDLEARLARGAVLYVHCWGGRGRAGTVGSSLLAHMYKWVAARGACVHVRLLALSGRHCWGAIVEAM
jgi:hypothetical protein